MFDARSLDRMRSRMTGRWHPWLVIAPATLGVLLTVGHLRDPASWLARVNDVYSWTATVANLVVFGRTSPPGCIGNVLWMLIVVGLGPVSWVLYGMATGALLRRRERSRRAASSPADGGDLPRAEERSHGV